MEIIATSKNYENKKDSNYFQDILNPYGKKNPIIKKKKKF
jgi:hypothetical protein